VSEPGVCSLCSRSDMMREGLCPSCWRYLYPDAPDPFRGVAPRDSVRPMLLKTFLKSLIPMLDALANVLPPVHAEASALAEALRKHVDDTSAGPGSPPI
jgi:hypothetical protein